MPNFLGVCGFYLLCLVWKKNADEVLFFFNGCRFSFALFSFSVCMYDAFFFLFLTQRWGNQKFMPDFTTPFLLTVRGNEQVPLRECGSALRSFSFTAALTAVVFTRRLATTPLVPVTVSLVLHCGGASQDDSNNGRISFTIASHQFAALMSDKSVEEEAVVVPLRSPIVLTSQGAVHSLEVRCTAMKHGDHALSHAAQSEAYGVTIHGTQRTSLTKAQVELLCSAGRKMGPE